MIIHIAILHWYIYQKFLTLSKGILNQIQLGYSFLLILINLHKIVKLSLIFIIIIIFITHHHKSTFILIIHFKKMPHQSIDIFRMTKGKGVIDPYPDHWVLCFLADCDDSLRLVHAQ